MNFGIPSGYVDNNVFLKKPCLPETERKARLRALKEQRADTIIAHRRLADHRAAVAKVDAELDEETARHVEKCKPIQSELASIEQLQKTALIEGRPFDREQEQRRIALANTLAELNDSLAEVVRRAEDKKQRLAEEAREVIAKAAMTPSVIDTKIIKECSRQADVDEMFTLGTARFWAIRRLEFAQKLHSEFSQAAESAAKGRDREYAAETAEATRKLKLEVDAAMAAAAAFNGKSEEIRNRILSQ